MSIELRSSLAKDSAFDVLCFGCPKPPVVLAQWVGLTDALLIGEMHESNWFHYIIINQVNLAPLREFVERRRLLTLDS